MSGNKIDLNFVNGINLSLEDRRQLGHRQYPVPRTWLWSPKSVRPWDELRDNGSLKLPYHV
jgi:hypothetical protein